MRLGLMGVAYRPWVNVILTSDLVSRADIKSGAYILYSLRHEFRICDVDASMDGEVSHTIFWSL